MSSMPVVYRCLVWFTILPCLSVAESEPEDRAEHRDSLRSRQPFLRKCLVGTASGAIHGTIAGAVGALVESSTCGGDLYCGLRGLAVGSGVGYTAGTAIGVHATGRSLDEHAPLAATFLGSAVGLVLGIGATSSENMLWPSILLLPPLVATLLHDSTRSWPPAAGEEARLRREMGITLKRTAQASMVVLRLRL